MKARVMLAGAAIVACLAFAIPTQDTRPQDSRQDESARKIELLTRSLDAQKAKVVALEQRLDRIDTWFRRMYLAAHRLDQIADDSRRNGFESAGANPVAKTILLEGMKSFAAALQSEMPVAVVGIVDEPR
jgi:hypothetical protein